MKMYRAWKVWFRYSENIYCTNICYGTLEDVEDHYGKYPEKGINEATMGDVIEAECKGMPIVKI